jgi:hypothetical protein
VRERRALSFDLPFDLRQCVGDCRDYASHIVAGGRSVIQVDSRQRRARLLRPRRDRAELRRSTGAVALIIR